jgi:hypothetical protein
MDDSVFTSANKNSTISNYNNNIFNGCVINFNPNTVLITAVTATVLIVIAGLLSSYITYELNNGESTLLLKLFDLDEEQNIPTFFSYFLLSFCCFLLIIIYLQQRGLKSKWSTYWLFLAIMFFILSFDEAASIHERFSLPVRTYLGTTGWLRFGWIIPAGFFVSTIGLMYIRFIISLSGRIATLSFLSGILYVGGALFMEMPEGAYAQVHGENNFIFHIFTILEETFEMMGLSLYLYTLTLFLSCSSHENSRYR